MNVMTSFSNGNYTWLQIDQLPGGPGSPGGPCSPFCPSFPICPLGPGGPAFALNASSEPS